jgi:hypothetical protein
VIGAVHSTYDALSVLGWLIVAGCIIAAVVYATRAAWVVCLCLLAVAIVAAALLL